MGHVGAGAEHLGDDRKDAFESAPSFTDAGAAHERMDAPFGSQMEHTSEMPSNIIDPRRIQVVSLDNPRAFLYKRFMSDAECDFMVVGTYVLPVTP